MSGWNIGLNDVSEETQALKDKVSSKDTQIAAQQTQLMRKAAELEEFQSTLNDALHRLTRETNRVLQLESELNIRSEELRGEKITSQNISQSLEAAKERIRQKELETRELESHLERLSQTSDGHNSKSARLESEKSVLEARVRELENNLRQLSCPPPTPARPTALRPRSSSLSNFRITSLEQELKDVRAVLSQKDGDLYLVNEKLSQVQNELLRVNNDKLAGDKRASKQIAELQTLLDEKQDELQYLRQHQDDGTREEELMRRIEEDEAKIMALEKLAADGQDTKRLKEQLRRTEEKLKEEKRRVADTVKKQNELIEEKEKVLGELRTTHMEVAKLQELVRQREDHINTLTKDRLNTMKVDPTSSLENGQTALDAESVAKLLTAIERIRNERDNLQRTIDFLETESKFTIQALQAKLSASQQDESSNETIYQLKTEIENLQAKVTEVTQREANLIQSKNLEIQRLGRAVAATAIVIQRDMVTRLNESEEDQTDLVAKLEESERNVDTNILHLNEMTRERDDLMVQLESRDAVWEDEVNRMKDNLAEAESNYEDATLRLTKLAQTVEDVESERNSLKVQVANLLADLRVAQDDLTKAESRYSSLQFHQLSSMSSNEAARTLQSQIEELEMRVMRRTEQIGIHQHDIKRLETNLRLSEEHIDELTAELETANAQKNAMVEDCADAREARDEALLRVEQLETEMEMRTEEGDAAATALVRVIVEKMDVSRRTISRLNEETNLAQRKFDQLEASHQNALQLIQKVPLLERQLLCSASEITQLTLALAVLQQGFLRASSSARHLQEENVHLLQKVQSQNDELGKSHFESTELLDQLENLQEQMSMKESEFAARASELEAQILELHDTISRSEESHRSAIATLTSSHQQRISSESDLEQQLSLIKAHHAQNLADIQSRLKQAMDERELLQERLEQADTDHHRALLEIVQSKEDFDKRLALVSEDLVQLREEKEQTLLTQAEKEAKILDLQSQLESASNVAAEAKSSREEIENLHQQLSDELARIKKSRADELALNTDQYLAIQQRLEAELSDLQSNYHEQALKLEEATRNIEDLSTKLEDEKSAHANDQRTYEEQKGLFEKQYEDAQSALTKLKQELVTSLNELSRSRQELEVVQQENLSLQEQITALEAEIQKSNSLVRYLESQIKESEQTALTMTDELERTQAKLTHFEKSTKTAEVNLTLQNAQHKREMADLQKELTSLKSRPDLQNALAELEERNNEMEELLRAKCTEIEENDDRALEMLKENKKLSAKVESLTRKVQNLQTKLAAAKAALPKPTSEIPIEKPTNPPLVPSPFSHPSPSIPQIPPVPSIPVSSISQAPHPLSSRVVSGQPSLPRSKTPERIATITPVFKARTPVKEVIPPLPTDPMPSEITIGKKRRAPDDFEACESLPPQGFTADSLPSHELDSTTPRVRRIPSGLQNGFTPVRNQAARSAMPLPSPKRPASTTTRTSPPILDVTNSPRVKNSKRSWLGKIRGASTHAIGRAVDMRPRLGGDSS